MQGLPKVLKYPLLSQERVKSYEVQILYALSYDRLQQKPVNNFGKSSRGRSQGLPKIFRASIIYRAHRAVIFAIARLSCYYCIEYRQFPSDRATIMSTTKWSTDARRPPLSARPLSSQHTLTYLTRNKPLHSCESWSKSCTAEWRWVTDCFLNFNYWQQNTASEFCVSGTLKCK